MTREDLVDTTDEAPEFYRYWEDQYMIIPKCTLVINLKRKDNGKN